MNNLDKYNQIIKKLMANDSNGTWDEIMEDAGNNLTYAIELLKSALDRIITDDGLEGDELDFYIDILYVEIG